MGVIMKKVCLDMNENNNCIAVLKKDIDFIQAGVTVYSMPVEYKNSEYCNFADKYDVHFIFDDMVVKVDFYTVPRVDIMAVDSHNGYIGTVGEMSGLESNGPICYIDKNREVFLIAEDFREFLENIECWKERLKKYDEISFFNSKEEAEKSYEFIDVGKCVYDT